jgi:cystathionine gamma-synthase
VCRAADVEVLPGTDGNGAAGNGAGFYSQFEQGTLSVHGGERLGRPRVSDCLTTPICQTSTFRFQNTEELIAYQEGRYGSYEYGRYGNPTTRACEEKIRILEGAEDCLVAASGMNSATTMLLALVPAGGHIVTTTDCYRRTRQFIQTVLPKMGISATVIDPSDIGALKKALDEHTCSLFFSESPTNPYLRCVDVPAIKALCEPQNCLVCIDSTFATPINQKALQLGADIVLHSATKYMAGHNDVLAGAIVGKPDIVQVRYPHTSSVRRCLTKRTLLCRACAHDWQTVRDEIAPVSLDQMSCSATACYTASPHTFYSEVPIPSPMCCQPTPGTPHKPPHCAGQ